MASKSVKLFNLEERKSTTGTAITEVDIFQWKNTLIDNLKRDTEFQDFVQIQQDGTLKMLRIEVFKILHKVMEVQQPKQVQFIRCLQRLHPMLPSPSSERSQGEQSV